MPHRVEWLTNAALRLIREALGWDQKELAAMAGVSPATISDYELGRLAVPLERERLDELAALMGAPKAAVEIALGALEAIRSIAGAGAWDDELRLPRELREVLELAAAKIWRMRRQFLDSAGGDLLLEAARSQAAVVWEALRRLSHDDRRFLLDHTPGYISWATVERLAHESERAASRNVKQALELGALAVWAADHVPGPMSLQAAAKEYAWCYYGNAHRVKGSYAEALAAFAKAKSEAQNASPLAVSPFSRARMLDREVSLRRAQRRFGESLELSDEALGIADRSELGFLWLNRAHTLLQQGSPEVALSALQNAFDFLDDRSEPRHRWGAHFNLAVCMLDLGRTEQAKVLIPRIRELAEAKNDELDLIRVQWLEGRAAGAEGDIEVAITKLSQVWADFGARDMPLDTALAVLELAAVHLSVGHLAETRALALQTAKIFEALEIKREELASVRLFLVAAEQMRATAEQARVAYRALAAHGAQRGLPLATLCFQVDG